MEFILWSNYKGDKFGRILAYLIIDGKNISVELTRKGFEIQERRWEEKMRRGYFATTMFVAALVGVVSGIIANRADWRISLLAGYAGTDFLENLYKLRFAQFFKVS